MKQLRDLLEQRDQTIDRIREKILNNNNDDDEKATGYISYPLLLYFEVICCV
jgi:hypothetical protein